ncbi:MAG: phosphoglucosamine mutase [Bacteroidales bacterium]
MTLIKSISGIRGTIGNEPGNNLTPPDIVMFVSSFAEWTKKQAQSKNNYKMVIGRDARPSGNMVEQIATGTLIGMGFEVVNLGLASTPTVEIAVTEENADGGIIITASHNPVEWNALKLLNNQGEFLNDTEGNEVLEIAENNQIQYSQINNIGKTEEKEYLKKHIDKILSLPLVNTQKIAKANFTIAVDGINSVGGIAIPELLKRLGINNIVKINCEPTGQFAHNPEPLPENLTGIIEAVKNNHADLGIVVDPDVDRLAFVDENGKMFGEEYTIVAVSDYILQKKEGNTVSNLSSTKALKELTEKYGRKYTPSAVGEVNVIEKMKETNAVIGGEGNGGVIYPALHCGRDALVGVALFLTYLAESEMKCSDLRAKYPNYHISKNKIQLDENTNIEKILMSLQEKYTEYPLNTEDGLKIEFPEGWVHLRKSNTEPIIRVYSEGDSPEVTEKLSAKIIHDAKSLSS